jgi:chitin disaccharide deacetylase
MEDLLWRHIGCGHIVIFPTIPGLMWKNVKYLCAPQRGLRAQQHATLAALPKPRFRRSFDVGCSIGHNVNFRARSMRWLPTFGRKSADRVENLAQRLGFAGHERLLIVHADDLGIAHAINAAFISGFATGLINSGSVMVPGRSLGEVGAFAQAHPEADIGLHLTLTSDSAKEPWAPVASPSQVPSLIDGEGNFLRRWSSEPVNPREVEIELRAQIERAYGCGIRPTHLDSHQFRLLRSGMGVFEVYLRLAREYRLPVMVPRHWLPRFPYLQPALKECDVVLDRMVRINDQVTPEQWPTFYGRALERLPPGVTEILIHPGYDTEELQQFFEHRLPWGAAWRQRDLDFFTSNAFRDLLSQYDIRLITWREIAERLSSRSPLARIRRMFSSA